MSQHTPGPWTNQLKNGEAFICGSAVHVASVPIEDEQDEANARLIAAAPALLAALRSAVWALERGVYDVDSAAATGTNQTLREQYEAAIRAATETPA